MCENVASGKENVREIYSEHETYQNFKCILIQVLFERVLHRILMMAFVLAHLEFRDNISAGCFCTCTARLNRLNADARARAESNQNHVYA